MVRANGRRTCSIRIDRRTRANQSSTRLVLNVYRRTRCVCLRSASVVQLLFLPRTHVKPLFVDVDPRNLLPIVTKVVVSQIFATNSGVIHVLLCPLSPRFDVCTRQARYLLVTNFTPSSILTKSIHGHCTYPCPVLSLKRSVISSQVYSPSSSSDNSASTAASASVNRCAGPCLRSAAALPVERCLFMMS